MMMAIVPASLTCGYKSGWTDFLSSAFLLSSYPLKTSSHLLHLSLTTPTLPVILSFMSSLIPQ